MSDMVFQRARSTEAKQQREAAILEAAWVLSQTRGIGTITLTEIAEAVGMHKSALLRYFETREEIFLILTAKGWQEWSEEIRTCLRGLSELTPSNTALAFAQTLTARPQFCDLLSNTPLSLERNVSIEAVRIFKTVALGEVTKIIEVLMPAFELTTEQAIDFVATATGMAGALWQIASPSKEVAKLYLEDPQLSHAVVNARESLERILTALLMGFQVSKRVD